MSTADRTSNPRLDRRAVVKALLEERSDTLVVTGLGAATYDVAALGDNDHNFYLWGAMGGAAMVGLGLALAQSQRPIVVITGDGEMLMGLGALATIARQNPGNLSIVILDNERYGETGAQPTHTARVVNGKSRRADFAEIASACGFADTQTVRDETTLRKVAPTLHRIGTGTRLVNIKIDDRPQPKVIPVRDGAYAKGTFRRAIGLSPD